MKCERFIFRGNLSVLLIKVKITSSATVFCSRYNKLKILVFRNLNLAPKTVPPMAPFLYTS